MEKFITFKTEAQAKNYIKRHPSECYREGCGCCGHDSYYHIKNNRVIYFSLNQYAGEFSVYCKVVGKIKKGVRSNP
jgi:hypothetical protein